MQLFKEIYAYRSHAVNSTVRVQDHLFADAGSQILGKPDQGYV